MAARWPSTGPSLPDYLDQLTRDLEEARDAMARDKPRCAKRWVRAALRRDHPEAVNAAETVALVALGIGVVEPAPTAELPRVRTSQGGADR